MKLACDEMLQDLGRWLRAAGYDTFVASGGMPDRTVLAICAQEGRVLISKDRKLSAPAKAAGVRLVLLRGDDLQAHGRTLARALALDWNKAPFTRCQIDNTPLRTAGSDEIAQMPASARAGPGPFQVCPACGRLYWPGSHVRRMQARLEALGRGDA